MISRFSFHRQDDESGAARKLFANAHSLNISLNRGSVGHNGASYKPFLTFELTGHLEGSGRDLVATIQQLMTAFHELPIMDNEPHTGGGFDDDSSDGPITPGLG